MTFEQDLDFSKQVMPEILEQLRKLFPNLIFIDKFGTQIDRELSGDIMVEYDDRTELWAVKVRRVDYDTFSDITIEVDNGHGERGDWYRFAGGIIQKYIYVWYGERSRMMIITLAKQLTQLPDHFYKGNNPSGIAGRSFGVFQNDKYGRSTFTAIDVNKLTLLDGFTCAWIKW